jgi:hypothetical protein
MSAREAAVAVEACGHQQEHPQIQADLDALGRDRDRHEKAIGELFALARTSADGIAENGAGIARIEGKLEGALQAKQRAGTIIGVLVSVGVSGAIALIIALVRLAAGKGG